MADLHKAIRSIHSNAQAINGDTQDTIQAWDNDGVEITIDWTQVNAWTDPEQYKIDRKYPSIGDQLDMLYHDIKTGNLETGDWITAIEQVKTDNPKPSE